MKIYLKAYLNKNLGDDLFVKILLNRYKNHTFYIRAKSKYSKFFDKNLKRIKQFTLKAKSKLLKNNEIFEEYTQKKFDLVVVIGGSIFMQKENTSQFPIQNIYNENYYIIGANFGPYKNDQFLLSARDVFSQMSNICFRDKYSYSLFKNLKNVFYAPDIVFTLKPKTKKKAKKEVVFSIIDCDRKIGKDYTEEYENAIIEMTNFFINEGYDIIYMSFCKNENDELAINRILRKMDKSVKNKIKKYFYNGNIQEALNLISESTIIVGSRFHANILGLVYNKTIIPIAYSEKTINVLKDMDFKGEIIDIKNIKNFNIKDLTQENLNYKHNINREIELANKHFEKLDQILNEI